MLSRLNGTQKNIIETVMATYLDDITDLLKNPAEAIDALRSIENEYISTGKKFIYIRKNIWDDIQPIKEILSHPCPENRCESYPYVGQQEGYVMFRMDRKSIKEIKSNGDIELKNGRVIPINNVVRNNVEKDDYFIAKEKTGTLGLTGRENNEVAPVTREAVVEFIHALILKKIEEQTVLLNQKSAAYNPTLFTKNSDIGAYVKEALTAEELEILKPIDDLLTLSESQLNVLINNIRSFRKKEDSDNFSDADELVLTQRDHFIDGLNWLINHGVSLKIFAQMSEEKQVMFAMEGGLRLLMESGIGFEKLNKLDIVQLDQLLSEIHENDDNNQLHAELVFRNKETIQKVSDQIDKLISEITPMATPRKSS